MAPHFLQSYQSCTFYTFWLFKCGKCQIFWSWWPALKNSSKIVSVLKYFAHTILNNNRCDSFMTGAHSKSIYGKLNEEIEKMCDFIYIGLVDVSLVGLILPSLLTTLINYYVYDLNTESYTLPAGSSMYTHLTTKGWFLLIIIHW